MKKLIAKLVMLTMVLQLMTVIPAAAQEYGDFQYDTHKYDGLTITKYMGSDAEVTIPSEIDGWAVENIGEYAFFNNETLTKVTIPDSVTNIEDNAFWGCRQLKEVSLSNAITTIPKGCFENCSSIEAITIPESVQTIGESAFYGTSLGEVTIPDSVKSIGSYAFDQIYDLKTVVIGSGAETLGDYAFGWTYQLSSITVSEDNPYICSEDGVLYNKDKTVLYRYPQAKDTASFALPGTVTTVKTRAFDGARNITELNLNDGLVTVEEAAFARMSYIGELAIPKTVTSLGKEFIDSDCVSAFTVAEENQVYASQESVLFTKDMTTLLIYPSAREAEQYDIPSTVTKVEPMSFSSCGLKTITVPESMTVINEKAFASSYNTTSIILSETVTTIEASAFAYCSELKQLYIPASVTTIDDMAFEGMEFTMYGEGGSYAQSFAAENNIPFVVGQIPDAPVLAKGDLNGDDKINASDSLDVLQIAGQLMVPTPEQKAAADVNGDGLVNASDALRILQFAANIIDQL